MVNIVGYLPGTGYGMKTFFGGDGCMYYWYVITVLTITVVVVTVPDGRD